MKILICTSRIRPDGIQTIFPPLGAMAVIQSLITAGYEDTSLFDIDGLRPPEADVIAQLERDRPDVVGISGVVSTAYKFIKQLTHTIHEILPETVVVVGGNVAASSEILLRIAKVDYCVIGEGEVTMVELARYLESKGKRSAPDDYEALSRILGVTYITDGGDVAFTGYRPNIPAEGLYELDYDILERDTDINRYIVDPWFYDGFIYDPRSYQPHLKGKKMATLVSTKGCVAKCTFCHRWDKGIRFVGVDTIIERIQMLQERYNVGFISFSDENFGSDRRWVDDLLEKITPLGVLWRVGGVRCRTVNLDMLQRMRDAGCTNVQYGIESGSQRMLDVMEKNTQVEHNINAIKWTYEAGLHTVYSMVYGMPGETPDTIRETFEFLEDATEFLPDPPYNRMSVNRLEALPGTPVYEYAKLIGLIGRTPEEEEAYLLHISDTSGADAGKQLNFTDYPDFVVQSWHRRMWLEVMHHWYQKHPEGQAPLLRTLWGSLLARFRSRTSRSATRYSVQDSSKGRDLIDTFVDKDYNTRKDERVQAELGVQYHRSLYFMRHFLVLEGIAKDFFNKGIPKRWWLQKLLELPGYYVKGPRKNRFSAYRSLRASMKDWKPEPLTQSEENLIPLQLGR